MRDSAGFAPDFAVPASAGKTSLRRPERSAPARSTNPGTRFLPARPGKSEPENRRKGELICWGKYERYLQGERERKRKENDEELRRLEAAAAAAEMRTEQLFAEKAGRREPVTR